MKIGAEKIIRQIKAVRKIKRRNFRLSVKVNFSQILIDFLFKMEFKDNRKPKTWRFFRPAPKPKPEPSVAPQKIILVPLINQQKPASTPGSPLQPKGGPITVGEIHQKPASTLGSSLQPKRGPIVSNPNQMENGGQISGGPRRTANFGPWQATISNTCITCGIVAIIVLAILFLLTLAFSIFSLVVFLYNGDAGGNWNTLTTFPEYEYEAVEDTANRDY